ncbi:MAG: sterol desaturase family protein [Bryobacteraceae bacterium]|jgi:sterol desaturase/sphingolipid hydroxylase (fatty acid hydroxylase superfamily)
MEAFRQLQQHSLPLALDFLRLFIWLLLLTAIFVPLEKIFALHAQKVFRKAFLPDLAYYFLNGFSTKLLLILPMAAVVWGLHFLLPRALAAWVAAMPLGVRFAASMVVAEFGFYWGHRWSHEIPFLWRFHSIHHSAEEMDWLVNTRAHPVDMVFTRLCGFVPIYVVGLAQPTGHTLDMVTLLVILTGTVWGFFIHSNLNWRLGPLEWLVSTPAFHHWHHTYEEPLNKNYSPMLPWVDRLFRTYHMPKAQWPARYGTGTPVASDWADQLIDPLMPVRYDPAVPLNGGPKAESETIPAPDAGLI